MTVLTSIVVLLPFLLLLRFEICSSLASDLKVFVDGNKGADDPLCLSSPLEHRCKSLEYVHSRLVNSTNRYSAITITVCGPGINLTMALDFENYTNLAITGLGNERGSTYINCNQSLSGLAFKRVKSLQLTFLNLTKCGAKGRSTQIDPEANNSTVIINSALYFLNCTDISVFNVTIYRSNGTGISMCTIQMEPYTLKILTLWIITQQQDFQVPNLVVGLCI